MRPVTARNKVHLQDSPQLKKQLLLIVAPLTNQTIKVRLTAGSSTAGSGAMGMEAVAVAIGMGADPDPAQASISMLKSKSKHINSMSLL